ncbi:hypothetical protein MBANPS3_006510 [Mucor bainieri]
MGNSVSKTKAFSVNLRNKINQAQPNREGQQEPSSPHRTLVESDLLSAPNKMSKPSVLQNHSFFNNKTKATKKKSTPVHRQQRQHASVKSSTLSRKKPKYKKKVVITKSIIGRPTNFKHLTCTKNGMDNEDGNNEATTMAAQMIALAALIKPLPDIDPEKTLTPPIIPPRHSSYNNHIYIQKIALSLPSPPSPPSSSASSSSSCSSAVMQHDIPSVSISKSKIKSKSNKNYPSIKKGKKSNIKYASIGKGSIARKQVQHDKMPRQKRKTTKPEQAVNSLDL